MQAHVSATDLIELRRQAVDLFRGGVAASDPATAVATALEERRETIAAARRVVLVAFGKAACQMAEGALPFAGDKLHAALAVTNLENLRQVDGVQVMPGAHPLPDETSLAGALAIERAASGIGEGDLLLVLVSGGGSALVCAPASGITLADKVALNDALIRSGADIREINTVRQAFSRLKGGRLAQLAARGRVLSLILSDVPGDDVRTIASGPTASSVGSPGEALDILSRHGLSDTLGASMKQHLRNAADAAGAEAVSFDHVENVVVGSNGVSLDAVIKGASASYRTVLKADDWLSGDISEVADALHRLALSSARKKGTVAIVSGGEPTVKVKGSGKGGRNQELALRFAVLADRTPIGRPWVFLSGGTDGRDGPTDAAGGIVDAGSVARIRQCGYDAEAFLRRNDSYPALACCGDLLITGPTGTNVADLQILLIR